MKVKYVVFDFDGTLVDSKAVFIELYNRLAAKSGYTLMTTENIEHLRAMSIPERCEYLKVPLYKIPFVAAKFLKQYRASVPLLQFCNGIEEMLGVLIEKHVPIAVLSSNSKENISDFFTRKGIEIRDVFCSSNIFGKDRVLKKFLKAKGLAPSDILYIGDEARDIAACRKLGVKVAWVRWGYDAEEAIHNLPPDFTACTPQELLYLIITLCPEKANA